MGYYSRIKGVKETETGTDLIIHIPDEKLQDKIFRQRSYDAEIRIDDGRSITAEQRKKIFATIKDIALFTGDHPEDLRAWLLYDYCIETGEVPFSLSDCSLSTAREFINFMIDFILKENIPITEMALNRTDDIDRYLWGCIKYKKCCICGKEGETHHWDAIGMGRDRTSIDDNNLRKIQLCRIHHTEVHTIGEESFGAKYHVYGIVYSDT